jgi:hypothetical protein
VSVCAHGLERELQAELDEARVVDGGLGVAEEWVATVIDGQPELSVVEEVEEFGSEVQAHVFPWQLELFDDGEVGVYKVGTVYGHAVGVAEFTFQRLRKTSHVKVMGLGVVGIGVASGNLVRTLESVAVAAGIEGDAGGIVVVDQRNGEAGGNSFDEGDLPATEKRLGQVTPIVAVLLTSTEGQVIDNAGGEIIVEVDLRGPPIERLPIGQREVGGAQFGTQAIG